jgi:nitroimidazol reductase NimA-like FMN-containing flavoprotein (pyridoxamine 5'-phosphate oxidase superfamily)
MAEPTKAPRRTVRLSAEEAWATIEGSHTGIFTTMRRDGTPISLPVWFVVIDRNIYMTTPTGAKKVARVRSNSRAAFVVESGERWAELRAVHLTGHATVVDDDDDLIERVRAASDAKYNAFRVQREAMPKATTERYGRQAALIRFTPDDRILSWDNARMFDGPLPG